jgi:hypothetical protein
MNIRLLGVVATLSFTSILFAQGKTQVRDSQHLVASIDSQDPGTDEDSPKRKVLDLRKKKKKKHAVAQQPMVTGSTMPVFASPIYLPQPSAPGTAITASNGFLYIVAGQKLYKVSEKTLKTMQVSVLGRSDERTTGIEDTRKRRRKIVASNEDEPSLQKVSKKRKSVKSD